MTCIIRLIFFMIHLVLSTSYPAAISSSALCAIWPQDQLLFFNFPPVFFFIQPLDLLLFFAAPGDTARQLLCPLKKK